MDGTRFDRWTRRTFGRHVGVAAGGLIALLFDSGDSEEVFAKKRHKRNRRPTRKCQVARQSCREKGERCCD